MNVLVLNCGSSSVKFQIIETDEQLIEQDSDRRLASGIIERIGGQALITFQAEGHPKERRAEPLRDHRAAVDAILRWIISRSSNINNITSLSDIHAVGHRVVHGGEHFQKSARVNREVIEGIEECIDLAPLHNPANLKGIRAATELLGEGVPQAVVFDTSFHSTMPPSSYLYGIPYQLYRRYKIRRYGFHGTSHRYIAYRYRKLRNLEREQTNIITLHLGNGCSACAVLQGQSFDTSMGFTPLEGLIMGTRSGNIDPSLIEFLSAKSGMTIAEIDTLLNKQSGLFGLSGLTNDMRELLDEEAENQDRRATLAIDIFCQRVQQYIGGYMAEMGGTDAIAFSGGIGQNSPEVRRRICQGLGAIGIELDDEKNNHLNPADSADIGKDGSRVKVYMIPTNEELLIARDTFRVVADLPRQW
ncbi:MAG: acetate kinase [Deltaproteobacteria bacterium RIFOXYA12_FULL_58_15]|nr:MAG: acetate kinase [Deltaproteobacteria bacterium RIFOXYA12_FULL_58_15]OGR14712.1 MAG: acetate kinase [Deltaproteobacteria bacterium RIFOXYB12_FULL_58_9]